MKFSTRAIHVSDPTDPIGSVIPPISVSSTYTFDEKGQVRHYEYSRSNNPNREAWEATLASLESARHGIAFAAGNAAMSALLWLLKPGDRVIVERDIYGGTFRIFNEIARKYGIDASFVDTSDLEAFKEALNDKVKLVVVESVSNPLMKLTDIAAVADLCHRNGTLLLVDNTFLSPYFMRPLDLGADIVLHSTTKYLGGHSDLIGGVLATNDDDLAERLHYLQNANGVIPSPFDCWMALRSVKTLEVRMRAHNSNALQVARFLESHPKVERVYYPGLESHPQYELAQRQITDPYGVAGSSGMLSFTMADLGAAQRVTQAVKVFMLAESLGGVESLLEIPATMTHTSIPPEHRAADGLEDNLIRVSVGIENADDLIADLKQALERA